MIIIGIDPGRSGGLTSFIQTGGGDFVLETVAPMPLLTDKTIDILGVQRFIDTYPRDLIRVFLEKTNAVYGASSTSSYSFGRSTMAVEAALILLKISYELVLPTKWTKEILVGYPKLHKKDKPSLRYVPKKYPTLSLVPKGCRKDNDGMSDSVCIAEFGCRKVIKERGV